MIDPQEVEEMYEFVYNLSSSLSGEDWDQFTAISKDSDDGFNVTALSEDQVNELSRMYRELKGNEED